MCALPRGVAQGLHHPDRCPRPRPRGRRRRQSHRQPRGDAAHDVDLRTRPGRPRAGDERPAPRPRQRPQLTGAMTAPGREFFTAKTVAAALAEFRPSRRTGTETVGLDASIGRIPAADVIAAAPLPGFDRSSVDGYAVRARDTFGASESIPAYLTLRGSVA